MITLRFPTSPLLHLRYFAFVLNMLFIHSRPYWTFCPPLGHLMNSSRFTLSSAPLDTFKSEHIAFLSVSPSSFSLGCQLLGQVKDMPSTRSNRVPHTALSLSPLMAARVHQSNRERREIYYFQMSRQSNPGSGPTVDAIVSCIEPDKGCARHPLQHDTIQKYPGTRLCLNYNLFLMRKFIPAFVWVTGCRACSIRVAQPSKPSDTTSFSTMPAGEPT